MLKNHQSQIVNQPSPGPEGFKCGNLLRSWGDFSVTRSTCSALCQQYCWTCAPHHILQQHQAFAETIVGCWGYRSRGWVDCTYPVEHPDFPVHRRSRDAVSVVMDQGTVILRHLSGGFAEPTHVLDRRVLGALVFCSFVGRGRGNAKDRRIQQGEGGGVMVRQLEDNKCTVPTSNLATSCIYNWE